jgi:hypothetical protein
MFAGFGYFIRSISAAGTRENHTEQDVLGSPERKKQANARDYGFMFDLSRTGVQYQEIIFFHFKRCICMCAAL